MAKASGIELISKEFRNPMITSTFGTGELISAALDQGVEKKLFWELEAQRQTMAVQEWLAL